MSLISPCGRKIIISTITAPNTSMRYSAKARRYSGSSFKASEAMITPRIEPMPPSTTIARIIAESMKVKLSGLMKLLCAAKTTPTSPAQKAPSA